MVLIALVMCISLAGMCKFDERSVGAVWLFFCCILCIFDDCGIHNNDPEAVVALYNLDKEKSNTCAALGSRLTIFVGCVAVNGTMLGLVAGMRLGTLDSLMASQPIGGESLLAQITTGSLFLSTSTTFIVLSCKLLSKAVLRPKDMTMHNGAFHRHL